MCVKDHMTSIGSSFKNVGKKLELRNVGHIDGMLAYIYETLSLVLSTTGHISSCIILKGS